MKLKSPTIKTVIFGIMLLLIISTSSERVFCGEPAEVITVDGLSFANTLLLPGSEPIIDSEQYLKTALEDMNLNLTDTTITAFSWSRDANDTIETVETLRSFLLEKYRQAQGQNKRFIIVCHSWGTVLTYLALSSQSLQVPEDERIYVDLLITLGSPLGTDNAHDGSNYLEETLIIDYTYSWVNQYDFCNTCIPQVDRWFNYWAWGDAISGPLQGVMPFQTHDQWTDIRLDFSSIPDTYTTRNTTTTIIWHKYDSLQPGGIRDNQPLLDQVKSLLEDTPPASDIPPFGSMDSPGDGETVRSSIPVTGWALDDLTVAWVKIYRDPVSGEGSNRVFIGDAVFVEGARPDVEADYPQYPNASRAGWGYMMLTNFLPNGGNGTFKIHAIAGDYWGNETVLGTKTIICDNANAVKPFGALDTPAQGGIASGSDFINWGWVLTPQPNHIPTDGSTINVWVNGVNLGHPNYNIYRTDIATRFPGYANSEGAVGFFILDTTSYANGVHNMHWTATDSAGNTDGIGSRYFTVQNTASQDRKRESRSRSLFIPPTLSSAPVQVTKGFGGKNTMTGHYPVVNGCVHIDIQPLEPLKIHLNMKGNGKTNVRVKGYSVVQGHPRALPIGSSLDPVTGIFYWQPGPGFQGTHEWVFYLEHNGRRLEKKVIARIAR